jgi:hypothetical protein
MSVSIFESLLNPLFSLVMHLEECTKNEFFLNKEGCFVKLALQMYRRKIDAMDPFPGYQNANEPALRAELA